MPGQWIGDLGGPQIWDFRNAPGNAENRYFYRSVDDGTPEKASFPDAEIMERLSRDLAPANDVAYIRYLPGEGKETVGISTQEGGAQSDSLFESPLLEYPVVVNHGGKWDDDTTYPITLTVLTVFVEATVRVDQKAEVDGWGTVILPEIGEVEALRVNLASRHTTGFHTSPDHPKPMGDGTLTIRKMPEKSILSWIFPNALEGATYSVEQSMTLGRAGNPWSQVTRTKELSLEVANGNEENYFRVLQLQE